MGGIGSGRKAEVYSGIVEESLHLDVNLLVRDGSIRQRCQTSGVISWDSLIGTGASIGYEAECCVENGNIQLKYRTSHIITGEQDIEYNVELFTTKQHFGGRRWWFICPTPDCERMVVKLYRPPRATHFLCRTCHNLTYQSCRDSGDRFFEELVKGTGLSIRVIKKIWKESALKLREKTLS